ncbi:uncharacterized protein Triagg1_607 [Trichoderma aggressivum f. europaeum]|uniref:Uncharacterized protein n=1 Tax=Trichoderma aggressivum f. europaeum TaxID=173218 RepID=A0AAE1IKJ6_9HYPO|nr:hypothetical protein Triagg1_607 [Trichoderma aggressivum f. europaeum]
MSKYAEMAKGKLSSGREKASEYKGKAKGKVTKHIPGRGHKEENDAPSHVARPLASLRDPNSFAPPPKRTGSGLAPPPPPSTAKRSVVAAPSKYQDPHGPRVEPPPRFADEHQLEAYEADQEAQPASSGPYRVNTTGLTTDHLPPPPVRRDAAGSRSPPSYDSVVGAAPGDTKAPSLPPRLPPRSGSGTPDRTASPLSTLGVSSGSLNQGAINRLGAAGISVPAFGIGSSSPSHADDEAPPPKPPRPNATPPSHLNELQNRFARLGTSHTGSSTGPPTPPTEAAAVAAVAAAAAPAAATWAQKQAAIKPAAPSPSPTGLPGLAGKKKPPPPPPKKKPGLAAAAPSPGDGGPPPPIPLSTRPSF